MKFMDVIHIFSGFIINGEWNSLHSQAHICLPTDARSKFSRVGINKMIK